MHHARAPMGWTPNGNSTQAARYPDPQYARPYPEGMPAQPAPVPHGQWMYPADVSAGHAAYPSAPAYPQSPAHPEARAYSPAVAFPQAQPYPPTPFQAYGQPVAPQMPQQGSGYGAYPGQAQGWNVQSAAAYAMPQPVDPRSMPQHPYGDRTGWSYPSHPGMSEPGYPHAYGPSAAMAPGWPQQGWQQPPASQPQDRREVQSAPRSGAGDGDRSALEEIRDSLREFREALRDLAESRGRRRFL